MYRNTKGSIAKVFSIGLVAISLVACNDENDSENVESKDIWAEVSIESLGRDNTKAIALLRVKDEEGAHIRLTSGEDLQIKTSRESVQMQRPDLESQHYEAELTGNLSLTNIQLHFERKDKPSLTASNVTLPQSFAVTYPEEGFEVEFKDVVPLSWDAPQQAGKMILVLQNKCKTSADAELVITKELELEDTGRYQLNTGEHSLDADVNLDKSKPCELNLTFRRTASGTIDSGFAANSVIKASQVRGRKLAFSF